MADLDLVVVADIHHGAVSFTKQGPSALPLLRGVIDAAADAAALIDLGDRISDIDAKTDRVLLGEVAAAFATCRVPRHHVDGNHDRAFLSGSDNAEALGNPGGTRAVDLGDVRAVFWQPDVTLRADRPLRLAPGDLDALATALGGDERRTLLFSHVPLSGAGMASNYWFENNPEHAGYVQSQAAIRSVIAAAPCPVVAVAGHVHWNSLTVVDGTPHLTLQSLTESFTTAGAACGAWARLTVRNDHLVWRADGADPVALELRFPRLKPRAWPRSLPRFVAADKVLRSDATEFRNTREHQPLPKTGSGRGRASPIGCWRAMRASRRASG